MSQLADKTDIWTIRAAARAIKAMDKVCATMPFTNRITAEDDQHWTKAKDHLFAIVETAGYKVDPDSYRVKRVNSGYPDYKEGKR